MPPTYVQENAAERQRLLRVTAKLTEEDLARPLPGGWSVATKLVHLAFWDQYYLSLLRRWEQTGFTASPADVDAINEAVLVLSAAMPLRSVVPFVLDAAEAVDRKVEELTPELATAIDRSGHTRILYRAMHRREHLDEIESALSLKS